MDGLKYGEIELMVKTVSLVPKYINFVENSMDGSMRYQCLHDWDTALSDIHQKAIICFVTSNHAVKKYSDILGFCYRPQRSQIRLSCDILICKGSVTDCQDNELGCYIVLWYVFQLGFITQYIISMWKILWYNNHIIKM